VALVKDLAGSALHASLQACVSRQSNDIAHRKAAVPDGSTGSSTPGTAFLELNARRGVELLRRQAPAAGIFTGIGVVMDAMR